MPKLLNVHVWGKYANIYIHVRGHQDQNYGLYINWIDTDRQKYGL